MSSSLGRFTSPDAPFADQFTVNPQSWNLYSYVRNNPIRHIDPDGHQAIEYVIEGAAAGAIAVGLYHYGKNILEDAIGGEISETNPALVLIGTGLSLAYVHAQKQSEVKDVHIDPTKYPEAAGHAEDAQNAGQPDVLTVDRPGSRTRRRESTAGVQSEPGSDRDEYPPAVTAEGGKGASVKNIPSSDNRGAGGSLGQQIRNVPNGGKIRIIPKAKPTAPPRPNPKPEPEPENL